MADYKNEDEVVKGEVTPSTPIEVDLDAALEEALGNVTGEVTYDMTSELRAEPAFEPKLEVNGGLNIGQLEEVSYIEWDAPLVDKEGKPSKFEYRGNKIGKLVIVIRSVPNGTTAQNRYRHEFTLPVKTKNDGSLQTVKDFNGFVGNQINQIREFFNAYGTDGVTPLNVNIAKILPRFEDATDTRVKNWNLALQFIARSFNTAKAGKPIFKDAADEFLPIWFVLRPAFSTKFTTYEIPSYVGSGFVELVKIVDGQIAQPFIKCDPTVSLVLEEKVKKGGKGSTATSSEGSAASKTSAAGADLKAKLANLGVNY